MVDHLANTDANTQRITMVENCFGTTGQPLAVQGRVLVGEGLLTKVCRKKPKPRMFFLFNDILVYGSVIIPKKKFVSQHIIPLEDINIEDLVDDDGLKNRWMVKTSQKSFIVCAVTPFEKEDWLKHINRCVEQLMEKTGRKQSTEHAAPWIPDKMTEICMRCTQTKFNAMVRKHHCRKCGFVVCQSCSKQKFLMPKQSSKPLRVCTLCYDKLVEHQKKELATEVDALSTVGNATMSSGEDDSDKSSDEDKHEQWMNQDPFFLEDHPRSSFHT
ncbi:pleckstrin homology domain-containing family F member 1 [Callorhinchus milii]|uniref:Pleckstrin homology and FYVE domain containing 1 n=1 Tax=Callorhinchus milii TaxID=7868 RepID=A0A4W3JDM5_CALMI|nr:pleckstrin homology domain-containing family F member 1 [Callorhinchus milii]XP_042196115.1 pleckstrin homology domain-containing family F member 1 [Callorhinchus milii]XP_042196116.1 pleckstrin homology domain-containing family F member 1 [Callorhinchus milii]|eukprot:gi/632944589/ref/XP_007887588.1/ PREDICTED: pleckstrin homology domain-containing family F member 1 [Callorhinchus milii]